MIHGAHAAGRAVILHIVAGIDLTADDGMDAALFGFRVKIDDPIHRAMVGDGAGIHAQLLDAVKQRADAVCAVQQAVFGVKVQMCKGHADAPFQSGSGRKTQAPARGVNVMAGAMRVSKEIWMDSSQVS